MRKNVIIDSDPGMGFPFADIDDNLAILMAFRSSSIEVRLVTLVFGNVKLEEGSASLNNFFRMSGYRAPAALGCGKPLFRHSPSGQETVRRLVGEKETKLDLSPSLGAERIDGVERNAVHKILTTIRDLRKAGEEVVLVALGPLTNIALAIVTDPQTMSKLDRMIIMGGSLMSEIRGVQTSRIEFNFGTDPEAARIVLDSDIPIVLVPLDVTTKVRIYCEELERVLTKESPLDDFILQSARDWTGVLRAARQDHAFFHPHDPVAMSYLVDKSIFEIEKCALEVETKGEFTSGEVIKSLSTKTPVHICTDIDEKKFKALFYQLIGNR